MHNLNLNAFYVIYDNECNKSNDLLTTKMLSYFDVHCTQHNKLVVAEKINLYICKSRIRLYEMFEEDVIKNKKKKILLILLFLHKKIFNDLQLPNL